MTRVTPGTEDWGPKLNADLDSIEDEAEAAQAAADVADDKADAAQAAITAQAASDAATYLPLSQKGAAGGVATLDGTSRIPDVQLPDSLTRDAEVAAGYVARPPLASWPVFIYGNSYSILSAPYFTSGKHYTELLSQALGGGAVTSYGVSGRRIIDVISSLVNGVAFPGCSGVVAAGKWPGVSARQGLVILESVINDFGHYASSATNIPATATTAYRNAMKVAYRAALAIMSSESRIEQSSASTSGTWNLNSGAAYASSGATHYSSTSGATVTYTVTPPQSGPLAGVVFHLGYVLDPSVGAMAPTEIRVDGVLQTSRTPAPWEQYTGYAGTVNVGPDVVAITVPIDGASHSVEIKSVGAGYMYTDAMLIPSINPDPIAVMGAEHTVLAWNTVDRAKYHDNVRVMTPDIKSVVAEFPHAFYVPSNLTTQGLYSGDGIHPNDMGMAQRKADLEAAMIADSVRGRLEAHRLVGAGGYAIL